MIGALYQSYIGFLTNAFCKFIVKIQVIIQTTTGNTMATFGRHSIATDGFHISINIFRLLERNLYLVMKKQLRSSTSQSLYTCVAVWRAADDTFATERRPHVGLRSTGFLLPCDTTFRSKKRHKSLKTNTSSLDVCIHD